jgi:hypothetical protein
MATSIEAPMPGQTTSTDVGWYKKELPKLGDEVYDLFKKYPELDVEAHILDIVSNKEYAIHLSYPLT